MFDLNPQFIRRIIDIYNENKIYSLTTIHEDNFYNEWSHAKSISDSLPITGIPKSVRNLFVEIVCLCYIGNGLGYRDGVDESAVRYYNKFLEQFKIEEIKEFIILLQECEFVIDLDKSKADSRIRGLCKYFESKTENVHILKLLNYIFNYNTRLIYKIADTSKFKEMIKDIK